MPDQKALRDEHREAVTLELLRTHLPAYDRALIGWPNILAHFARLSITRQNGRPLHTRILRRWQRLYHCPIVHGRRIGTTRTPPMSTTAALSAWILATRDTASLYRVGPIVAPHGKKPRSQGSAPRNHSLRTAA